MPTVESCSLSTVAANSAGAISKHPRRPSCPFDTTVNISSPTSSKKRFQRLRVRSLSRNRNSAKPKDESNSIVTQLANPALRRRNNSAGNIYAVDSYLTAMDRSGLSGSITRASRSTLELVQDLQRNTLKHLSKSWDSLGRMAEGRNCQIILLDGRKIEIFVQPKLAAGDLLDIVSSHYNLKEKEYFGLCYPDETNHYHWLHLERKVLEHEFFAAAPKKNKSIVLYFMVKFFVESITHLRDAVTVELFYLQAKALVLKGVIQTEQETAFELASYALQASYGDFIDVESTIDQLRKHQFLPSKIIKESASATFCDERILEFYRKWKGLPRGNAIVNYLTIIETLPTYGIHYYDVIDKNGENFILGISYKGISQYQLDDKKTAEKVFLWKDLGNLFFRDKKFSAEVLEARRVSVSRRTFAPGQLTVHVWFAATPSLAKAIWTMAISQHQFYLEKKKNQNAVDQRSPAEIAAELTNVTSLYSVSDTFRPRSGSVCSSYSYRIVRDGSLTSGFASDDSISQMSDIEKKEMFVTAKSKRDALCEVLAAKLLKLKEICIEEAQITGELPPETPLNPGEPVPQVRRRIGTAFELTSNRMESEALTGEEKDLADLELRYELQINITKAAEKLLNDAGAKTIRRQRKQAYRREHLKLKELEKALRDMRVTMDRDQLPFDVRDIQMSHSSSLSSGLGDSSSLQSFTRPPHSPALSLRSSTSRSSISIPEASSTPPSRSHSNSNFRPGTGYVPSAVYQTSTGYRHQQYPTMSPIAYAHTKPEMVHTSSLPNALTLEKKAAAAPIVRAEPKIINHQILVEGPVRIATSATLTASPAARATSWDRNRVRHVESTVRSPTLEPDLRYSTLDQRRRHRAREWQETTIDYHSRHPTTPAARLPANGPGSPPPVGYTAEITKPYELTDYYKYSNRMRQLIRTTPDGYDGKDCRSDIARSPNGTVLLAQNGPISASPIGNGYRISTASPSGGSSSSARSDRTMSPKLQTATAQLYVQSRPLQCLPALPRAARNEAQIAWNDEGVPKTPTIV
ncbi:FERM domain-containing protein 4A-like isoform X2 [Paramacrobiotus metropolitanus]|uniref:FERM domain-containing protein 4A-like isoform X2 n=1 Tax=Paramacrobiotus metropolitanus TaxID=2943436 RepID=UPI00244572E9|nr:FERM domain-containing protein 4A-like isoform X2 [Paramacrobiotus metropolitanus]